jgi:hypothetical protein
MPKLLNLTSVLNKSRIFFLFELEVSNDNIVHENKSEFRRIG